MKNESFEKKVNFASSLLICVFLGIGAVYIFLKYGLPLLLPFIIAWCIAMALSPLARRLTGKGKSGKAVSVILLFLLLSLIVLLLALAFDRLVYEIRRLMARLSEESETIYALLGDALDFVENLGEKIPFVNSITNGEELRGKIDSLIGNAMSGFVTEISGRIPTFLGNLISAFPSFLLFIIVTLVSSFYFCMDIGDIHTALKNILPPSGVQRLEHIKKRMAGTALKYLRAYLLIFLMTFGELFVGFSILRLEYSLLLAALIAVVDILPIFGVGSVLVPWASVLLIAGNYYMGIGLLIIYGCVTVVRQIAEPRIVGGSIGLHPLVTLIFTYAGFKLFGFFGMILGPAVALVLKSFLSPRKG